MRILDRTVLVAALWRWLLVLALGTFLVMAADFIGRMGTNLNAMGAQPSVWLLFTISRIPAFVLTFLPLSALAAGMLTVAPMLREGTLMALSAAGLAPARALRAVLVLAVASGGLAFVLADQVVPRLLPVTDRLDARLSRGNDDPDDARPAGVLLAHTHLSAARALPAAGVYEHLALFRTDGPRRALADRMRWVDGRWLAEGVDLAEGDRQAHLASAPLDRLGFDVPPVPEVLAERLKPDHARTSDELFALHAPRRWPLLLERLMGAVLPALCLAFALPRFIRWDDRHHLPKSAFWSLFWALPPLAGSALLTSLLKSAGAQPVLLAGAMTTALAAVAVVRWRRMAL